MKRSELKEYIKTQIREKLYAGASSVTPAKADPDYGRLKPQDKADIEKTLRMGGSVELEEMARKAVVFKVADDIKEKAKEIKTGGPISPKKLADALAFLEGKTEITGPDLAAGLGFVDENGKALMPRIYPVFAALILVDGLTATGGTETEEVSDEEVTGGEEIVGGEEEFISGGPAPEPEEEPTGIETAPPTILDPITKAAAEFTLDNDDLIQSIIRSYKDSKIRLKEAIKDDGEDLSAADYKKALQRGKEVGAEILVKKLDQLINKIKELEPEVQDKVLSTLDFKFKSVDASSLSKTLSKKLGKEIKPMSVSKTTDIDIEDLDDEEIMEDTGVEDVSYEPTFKDYENVYENENKNS
jgi:hypothetical protein